MTDTNTTDSGEQNMTDTNTTDSGELSWGKKGLALALISIMGFGCTFCFDSPAALQTDLKEALHMNQTQFMALYTAYSAPNIVMCVVGGFLVDVVLGRRIAAILFTFLVLSGQALLAFGISLGPDNIWMLYIARFVYGLGGESLITARSAYCVAWFSGSILNLAMGVALTITRLGSTVSINLLNPLYTSFQQHSQNSTGECDGCRVNNDTGEMELQPDTTLLAETMALAGLSCVISFVAALILLPMDKIWAPKREVEKTVDTKDDEEKESTWEFLKGKLTYDLGAWFLFAICLFYYCSIFPMISQGIEFFQSWWPEVDEAKARHLTSAPYIISMFLVPFIGIAIDYTKRNVLWCLLANVLTGGSFVLMLIVPSLDPWVPIIILSVGFSILACALWPMVSFLVPQKNIGMAYGVMQAIQNLGLALVGLATGVMVDHSCPHDIGDPPHCDGEYLSVIVLWLAFQVIAGCAIGLVWFRHGINCESLVPLEGATTEVKEGEDNKALDKTD